MPEQKETDWNEVIAKALAMLVVQHTLPESQTMLDRAALLRQLGIRNGDIASMLGTTTASLSEQQRQARLRKEKKRGKSNH